MFIRAIIFSAAIIALASCGNKNDNGKGNDADKKDTVATASLSPSAPANFTTDDLLGAWMAVEGDCYAEEINLDPGGTFSSYLQAKPFSDGTWTLENDKLTIKLKDNTELKYSAKLDENKMMLTLTDAAGKTSVYEAIVGC